MLICATLWSIAGIFMKMLPWNGLAIASLRSFIAGLTILAYMLIRRIKITINKKTLLAGFFAGMTYLCFATANKLTTAANAIVLQFTSPVFVLLYSSILFGKKINGIDIITVIVTLAGISLCFLDGLQAGHFLGNLISVAAGIFMAGMYVFVGDLPEDERYSGALLGQCFTALAGLPWVLITRPVFTAETVSCILILGIFQLGISYILYVKSTKFCPPLACCLLGVIEPLLNPLWVMLFNGETPGPIALVGEIIVIVTVTLWCAFGKKEDPV